MKGPQQDAERTTVDRAFDLAENAVYGVLAVLLVAGAGALLVDSTYQFVTHLDDDVLDAVKVMLEGLLVVFILVELLAAIRATVRERKLVAEPFLLVGMIAAIKEVVLTGVEAREYVESDAEAFERAMVSTVVLAALLLVLAVATLLMRRKEREPTE